MRWIMYRHRYVSLEEFTVEQKSSYGWRRSSEESAGYKAWVADGGIPRVIPYIPRKEPSLDSLRRSKQQEIAEAWRNDVDFVGMPLEGYSFNVDYDIEDALIWETGITYLSPEATEIKIRAIDNTFHVVPRNVFEQVPSLQKAYYASQLQKKWALQEAASTASQEELEMLRWG